MIEVRRERERERDSCLRQDVLPDVFTAGAYTEGATVGGQQEAPCVRMADREERQKNVTTPSDVC